jgi:hypothetical protein
MISVKPRILFFSPVRHALAQYQELASLAEVELVSSADRSEFFKDVEGKYKNITAIYSTSSSYAVSERLYHLLETNVRNRLLENLMQSLSKSFQLP